MQFPSKPNLNIKTKNIWVDNILKILQNENYFSTNLSKNKQTTKSFLNPLYEDEIFQENESLDLINIILFLKRVEEWFPKSKDLMMQYSWTAQEHVRRAILYGNPEDEEDLLRLLLPNEKGIWMHKMVTRGDIVREGLIRNSGETMS